MIKIVRHVAVLIRSIQSNLWGGLSSAAAAALSSWSSSSSLCPSSAVDALYKFVDAVNTPAAVGDRCWLLKVFFRESKLVPGMLPVDSNKVRASSMRLVIHSSFLSAASRRRALGFRASCRFRSSSIALSAVFFPSAPPQSLKYSSSSSPVQILRLRCLYCLFIFRSSLLSWLRKA